MIKINLKKLSLLRQQYLFIGSFTSSHPNRRSSLMVRQCMIKSFVSLPIGLSYGKRKGTVLMFLRNELISLAGQGLKKQTNIIRV